MNSDEILPGVSVKFTFLNNGGEAFIPSQLTRLTQVYYQY